MKRFLVLLFALCLIFVSCADKTVIENDASSSEATESEESKSDESVFQGNEYVGNASTLKYHTSYCTYINSIDAESTIIVTSVQELVDRGYSPCDFCIARAN